MHLRTEASWLRDAALAAVPAGVLTFELLVHEPHVGVLPVLCGLMITAPLLVRRAAPVASFVVTVGGVLCLSSLVPGFEDQTAFVVLPLFVSLYSVGRHARDLEAWVGALAVLCVALFIWGERSGSVDLAAIAWGSISGAPWAAGLTLRLKEDRESVLESAAERMRQQHQDDVQRLVATERANIARELHDVVAHAIAVTVLQSRGARRMLGSDEESVRQALDAIEHTNTQALGDMRRLLAALRDTETQPTAGPQPSLARLESLVDQVRDSGLAVDLTATGVPREVPPGVDLSAYRIIQEALTNVIKHAAATRAEVRLHYAEHALAITVSDDGTSTSTSTNGAGHGLIGIRERVAVVGGDVRFGTGALGGFLVEAQLPYALEDA